LGACGQIPAVGCVIVDAQGHIAGQGWTQDGGRPHAETEAIRQAGARARGGVAHVTLEPCAHQGQTGPCAEALIVRASPALFRRPRILIRAFADAGMNACGWRASRSPQGFLKSEARALNAGFLSRVERGRPLRHAQGGDDA
jgi:diaminohydroxyphosphoribosylaminopyrimidine deaminase/5-amino-6-(5-phosphoribosylamino)uracil reductase